MILPFRTGACFANTCIKEPCDDKGLHLLLDTQQHIKTTHNNTNSDNTTTNDNHANNDHTNDETNDTYFIYHSLTRSAPRQAREAPSILLGAAGALCRGEAQIPASVNKSTPPEKKTRGQISLTNTKSGAGKQLLLLCCRAKAWAKGVYFSPTTGSTAC